MKFLCECGHAIYDQTDDLPYKAYSFPDQSMEALYAAVQRLMDSPTPSPTDHVQRDAMTESIFFPKGRRLMYQCPQCGRIYITDEGGLHSFKPEFEGTPRVLFQASPAPEQTT